MANPPPAPPLQRMLAMTNTPPLHHNYYWVNAEQKYAIPGYGNRYTEAEFLQNPGVAPPKDGSTYSWNEEQEQWMQVQAGGRRKSRRTKRRAQRRSRRRSTRRSANRR